MKAKILSSLMYVFRWLAWSFYHLLLLPAGTLLLTCLFLFWLEGSTPGRMMAAEIISVTQSVRPGQFIVSGCADMKDPRQRNICAREEITDAAGYAAHIDRSFYDALMGLWIALAVISAGQSLTTRTFPVYRCYGQTRSLLFTRDRSLKD